MSYDFHSYSQQFTSLARETRPWTVVTTDQASVDILRTTVSAAPAIESNEMLKKQQGMPKIVELKKMRDGGERKLNARNVSKMKLHNRVKEFLQAQFHPKKRVFLSQIDKITCITTQSYPVSIKTSKREILLAFKNKTMSWTRLRG